MSETLKTFKVAILLCLVCSVIVSTLAVGLGPTQERKREEFRQQSVLSAAGVWKDGSDPAKLFAAKAEVINLNLTTGEPVEKEDKDPRFNLTKALQDKSLHQDLERSIDVAGLKKLENFTTIYQVKASTDDGNRDILVMPVRGKGLWSTLWGFVALDVTDIQDGPEAVTIAGLTYYQHGETPGLGGEVDNPKWKSMWPGKKVFDADWNVLVEVSKTASSDYQVDALSGATLTSNGVTNMLEFWLGQNGFGPYLQSIAGETASSAKTAANTTKTRS